jgi:hypothetical protein
MTKSDFELRGGKTGASLRDQVLNVGATVEEEVGQDI